MKILSYNEIRDVIITASSENELFTKENVYSKRKFEEFRFTGKTSEWIKFYNSDGIEFDTVIIDNHNLTDSAVVHLQANATDVWTSPTIDITATVGDVISYQWSTSQDYDYFRITFADTTNTDNIEAGMIFLADAYSFNILPGWSEDNSITGRAEYRSISTTLEPVEATGRNNLITIKNDISGTISLSETRQQFGTAWPFYIIVDPDDLTIIPIYGILPSGVNLTRTQGLPVTWDGSLTFEEVF